jgi:hypothetical protein
MTKVHREAPRNHYEKVKIDAYLRVTTGLEVPEVMMTAHPALKMDHSRRLGSTQDTRYRR